MKKLSYRDKIIVLVALIILIVFGGIYLFIKPAFDDVKAAKNDLEDARAKWTEVQNIAAQIDEVRERIDVKYNEAVEFSQLFYDEQTLSYNLDQLMQSYFDRNGIVIKSLNVTNAGVMELNPYTAARLENTDYRIKSSANLNSHAADAEENTEDNASSADENLIVGEQIAYGTVDVNFKTTRPQLLSLMQEFKDGGKAIEINSIDFSMFYNELAQGQVESNMNITVYYAEPISPLNEEPAEEQTAENAENTTES